MTVHLFTAQLQPATHWVDEHTNPQLELGWRGNSLLWCNCCDRRRRAKNCVVQSYYDGIYIWCAPGKGCKSTREIEAKRKLEFRNRSNGQKRRWANQEETT